MNANAFDVYAFEARRGITVYGRTRGLFPEIGARVLELSLRCDRPSRMELVVLVSLPPGKFYCCDTARHWIGKN
jgi:hypothetical protein